MRLSFLLSCLLLSLGCRESALPASAAPTFVKPEATSSIASAPVLWNAGETMAWKVRWRGVHVGTATLGVVGEARALRVQSDFRTIGMAEELRPQRHQLVTRLACGSDGIDDIHCALGRLRGWAHPSARPAELRIQHEDRTYLLELAQPTLDHQLSTPRLRVDGRAQAGSMRIDISIWLSMDATHTPLMFTFRHQGQQVSGALDSQES